MVFILLQGALALMSMKTKLGQPTTAKPPRPVAAVTVVLPKFSLRAAFPALTLRKLAASGGRA